MWHVIDTNMYTTATFNPSGSPEKLGSINVKGFSQTEIERTL